MRRAGRRPAGPARATGNTPGAEEAGCFDFEALAQRPLFAAIADLLRGFPAGRLPSLACLDERFAQAATRSGGDVPLRLVEAAEAGGYEVRIYRDGCLPTRPDNWHDFFNALVWLAFPRAKAALNRRHVEAMAERAAGSRSGRGALRDALTQFDECGVLAVSADAELPGLLRAHRWREAFWDRRAALRRNMRFVVFGHATYDQLRRPFFGLCGKALYRVVEPGWLDLPPAAQRRELDAWLAGRIGEPGGFDGPRRCSPLPLLGIPGVTPASECAEYYLDPRQFRPRRPTPGEGALECQARREK